MKRCASLALIIFLSFIGGLGQRHENVTLSGSVTDNIGSYVPSVRVIASSMSKEKVETKSDERGLYTLSLKPDVYSIQFIRAPFADFVVHRYQVPSHVRKMTLDISLICEDCEVVSWLLTPKDFQDNLMVDGIYSHGGETTLSSPLKVNLLR